MSDHIPFEIQSEIMKKLPVKSLVQFRSVSKQWKSFIDNPEFIKTYHINHTNPKHHLLVEYKLDRVKTYTSIVEDTTFPQQKFPQTPPGLLNLLRGTFTLGSVNGLLCIYGWYKDIELETWMIVLWNPSVRKCVGIPISNVCIETVETYTRIALGVCPETNDPKLVKINAVKSPSLCWDVQVFTLSSRVWKIVFTGAPLISGRLMFEHVFIDGIIYWSTSGSFILSFDFASEKFGEVSIPEGFVCTYGISVAKVNESLALLEYYEEGGLSVCGVWMRKDGGNKAFTKIYTVKVDSKSVFNRVLGFRNNGEVLLQSGGDYFVGSQIEVYEPSSGRILINSVGISGELFTFSVWSYTETLLLLDESNSIIQ